MNVYPVILLGGSGKRLWPVSRALYPKQFLKLTDAEHSMLQQTALRLGDTSYGPPIVITNQEYRFIVAEQLRAIGLDDYDLVLEPVGRNTGPAATAAAIMLADRDPEARMLLLPSDHLISDDGRIHEAVATGVAAGGEALVTFGVRPTTPSTGYGYIHVGEKLDGIDDCFDVRQFHEKPDLKTAQRYIDSDAYLWNSGIFLLPVALYLSEIEKYQPDIVAACRRAISEGQIDLDFFRLDEATFQQAPSLSIDHGLMEHTRHAVVVPVDFAWSDLGSWSSIWEISGKDASGNVLRGDVVVSDVSNSYIHSEAPLLAAIGLDGFVVVATDDAILVGDRERMEQVEKLAAELAKADRPELRERTTIHRPWGQYRVICEGEGFKVKIISVNPHQRLSLQSHTQRAEHWVVIRGEAMITCDEETFRLGWHESSHIPSGAVHRIENPASQQLEIIEVQTGTYVGEDDIVRYDDMYNRHVK